MSLLDSLLRRELTTWEPVRAPALDPLLTQCPVHEVGWYGPGECWCCAAGVPGLKTD